VVILIADGDLVLLGRRAKCSYAPGKWCLHGGFIEFNEDFFTAAIREVKEETGYDVEITSILSVMSNFLRAGLHTLVVVLEASIISGEPSPGDDIVELGWFPLDGPFPDMAFEADHHITLRYRETDLTGAPIDPEYARPSEITATPQ
jgi:ADP-ribose pyrophosphatase YjhB (NUDIX family)